MSTPKMKVPRKFTPVHSASFVFATVLVALTLYSFSGDFLHFGSLKLRKTPIAQFLGKTPERKPKKIFHHAPSFSTTLVSNDGGTTPAETTATTTANGLHEPSVNAYKTIDSTGERILAVGDSQLDGLIGPLADYCHKNRHTMLPPVIWYGSTSKTWGDCDTLTHFIEKYKPTCVIMTLGMNELLVNDIADREEYVDHILEQIDGVKFIWIGPANWKEDTGINDLLQRKVGSDRFFLSKHLQLARRKDGCHPTVEASRVWMDTVATWMASQSRYHLRLVKPDTLNVRRPGAIMMHI